MDPCSPHHHPTAVEPEPVAFADVRVGDTLTFRNRDTGYGADPRGILRSGTVTAVPPATVTVEIAGHNPLAMAVFRNGARRALGGTARLRARAWSDRQVHRVRQAGPAPDAGDRTPRRGAGESC